MQCLSETVGVVVNLTQPVALTLVVSALAAGDAKAVSGLLTQRSAAKEVRLFELAPWLVEDYRGLWVAAMVAVARRRARAGYLVMPGLVVVAAASAWGGWVIVAAGLNGHLGVARVTTLLLALLGLSAFGPKGDAQSSTNRVRQALVRLRSLQGDVEIAEHEPRVRADGVASGIALDGFATDACASTCRPGPTDLVQARVIRGRLRRIVTPAG